MDEMQFNFGMYPEYYRIGNGFSFSGHENADVGKTIKHCRAFQAKVSLTESHLKTLSPASN
jgi:hypothetical protein